MLKIVLAKFEVILTSETPTFIPVLVQMHFFLTFKRCSPENWSLVEGICMAVIMRAQYFKQSSLSPVWRLYLLVSYVTMPKLHGAECIHDEVV